MDCTLPTNWTWLCLTFTCFLHFFNFSDSINSILKAEAVAIVSFSVISNNLLWCIVKACMCLIKYPGKNFTIFTTLTSGIQHVELVCWLRSCEIFQGGFLYFIDGKFWGLKFSRINKFLFKYNLHDLIFRICT